MTRRVVALLILLLGAAPGWAASVQVPVTADLAGMGALVAQRQLPLLLVFAAEHCSYCELLDQEILKPMLISGDYRDKVIIRKVMIDDARRLRDFDGRPVDAGGFATRHEVFATPTILFVDAHGGELAPRLVGINTVEMYGGLVDAAIEQARAKLRAQAGMSPVAQAEPQPR